MLRFLSRSLVFKGTLIHIKCTGASGSFKLNEKAASEEPKKATGAATPKKSTTKEGPEEGEEPTVAAGAKKVSKSPKKVKAAKLKKAAKSPAKAKAPKPKVAKPKTAIQTQEGGH
ncbi:Histone H1.1 [Manis pentadactyla]|nr:Histone H1.1 [Manis pentadactyla]